MYLFLRALFLFLFSIYAGESIANGELNPFEETSKERQQNLVCK